MTTEGRNTRGHKICECGKKLGCRTKVCGHCGFDFTIAKPVLAKQKDKDRIEAEELMAAQNLSGLKIMYAHSEQAMECKIPLIGFNQTLVWEWCEDISTFFYGRGYFASPFLLRWLATKICPQEYKQIVREHIEGWQNSYLKVEY